MVQRIQDFYLTDTGKVRTKNQDACAIYKRRDLLLMIVADGVGGNKCGEIASRLTVETLKELFKETDMLDPGFFLIHGAKGTNERILSYVENHPECRGMATTLTAAVIEYPTLHVLHIGDSRAYLLRGGSLRRLTEDHTLVRRMVREGLLSPEEALYHPRRHVITNALGISEDQIYDYRRFKLKPGDQVLICSDGLYDEIGERDILELLLESSPEEAIRHLVDAANEAGGRDNISIALAVLNDGNLWEGEQL